MLSTLRIPSYPFPKDLKKVLDKHDKSKLSSESLKFSKILKTLSKVNYVDLSESDYLQLLKLALYLEEYNSNAELKRRKLFNQTIKKIDLKYPDGLFFSIQVENLDEERPWIRENDFVDVIDTSTDKSYTLQVVQLKRNTIIMNDDSRKFRDVFNPKHVYDINFSSEHYPLRCNHFALRIIYDENVTTYLFPDVSKSFIRMDDRVYGEIKMFNPNIETNPEQKQAVVNILNKSSFPAPYILYGPPGTGKTATLVEAICQIHQKSSNNRILVCAPSNTAADEVAKRALKFIEPNNVYRIYSQSKPKSTVDKTLQHCSHCGKGPISSRDIFGKAVLVTTLCTATRLILLQLRENYFSHIIIDEAGQGTEPDILIPISIASRNGKIHSQIVISGDPRQLGPTVMSKLANIILGRSILDRLMTYSIYRKNSHNKYNSKYITMLLNNYRSHPAIIHVSNKLFYDNELLPKCSNNDQNGTFPVIFHGVRGIESKSPNSTSTFNCQEIDVVLNYVYALLENRTEFGKVVAKDIGIVTPFTLQSKKIQAILKAKDREEKYKLQADIKEEIVMAMKNLRSILYSDNPEKEIDKLNAKIEGKIKILNKLMGYKPQNYGAKNVITRTKNPKSKLERNFLASFAKLELGDTKIESNEKGDAKSKSENLVRKLESILKDVHGYEKNKNVVFLKNKIKILDDKIENKIAIFKKLMECNDTKNVNSNTVNAKSKLESEHVNEEKDELKSKIEKKNDLCTKDFINKLRELSGEKEVSNEAEDTKCKLGSQNVKVIEKYEVESESENDSEVETDDVEAELSQLKNFNNINVGTVGLFQGQERKIMIMTAVRSKILLHEGKEHIGFLSHRKRFNVAMSRAKNALIVIGNADVLQRDDMWHYLLKYCIDNNSYRGFKFVLRTSSLNGQIDASESENVVTSESLFRDESSIGWLFNFRGLGEKSRVALAGPQASSSFYKQITSMNYNLSIQY